MRSVAVGAGVLVALALLCLVMPLGIVLSWFTIVAFFLFLCVEFWNVHTWIVKRLDRGGNERDPDAVDRVLGTMYGGEQEYAGTRNAKQSLGGRKHG